MPSIDERREVAARLRKLPIDMPSEMDKWEEDGLLIEPSIDDEVDYSQIHHVLLGCFPADHMHPCDYEDLHCRLADLIEPEELTCRNLGAYGGFECSICGFKERQLSEMECEPQDWCFCPNCGAKVVSE